MKPRSTVPADSRLCEEIAEQACALASLFGLLLDRLEERHEPVFRQNESLPANVIPFAPSRKRITRELVAECQADHLR